MDIGSITGTLELEDNLSPALATAATNVTQFAQTVSGTAPAVDKVSQSLTDLGSVMTALAHPIEFTKGLFEGMRAELGDTAVFQRFGSEVTALGQKTTAFGNSIADGIEHPMQFAKETLKSTLETLGPFAVGLGTIVTAAVAAGTALFDLAMNAAEVGGHINDMSEKMSLSAESTSRLDYAMRVAGGSIDQASNVIFMMQRRMGEGGATTEKFAASLKGIGISFDDFVQLKPDEQLYAVAKGFQENTNQTNRATTAMDLFGRVGRNMIPLLMKDLKGLSEQTHNVWSTEDAARAEALNMQWTALKDRISQIAIRLGTDLMPAVSATIDLFDKLYTAIEKVVTIGGLLPKLYDYAKQGLGEYRLQVETTNAVMDTANRLFANAAKEGLAYKDQLTQVATKMLDLGYTQENVAKATGLTTEQVKKLTEALNKGKTAAENFGEALKRALATGTINDIEELAKQMSNAGQLTGTAMKDMAKRVEEYTKAGIPLPPLLQGIVKGLGQKSVALKKSEEDLKHGEEAHKRYQKSLEELAKKQEDYAKIVEDYSRYHGRDYVRIMDEIGTSTYEGIAYDHARGIEVNVLSAIYKVNAEVIQQVIDAEKAWASQHQAVDQITHRLVEGLNGGSGLSPALLRLNTGMERLPVLAGQSVAGFTTLTRVVPQFTEDLQEAHQEIREMADRREAILSLAQAFSALGQAAGGSFGIILTGVSQYMLLLDRFNQRNEELILSGQSPVGMWSTKGGAGWAGVSMGAAAASNMVAQSQWGNTRAGLVTQGALTGAAIGSNPALMSWTGGASVAVGAGAGALVGWIAGMKEWRRVTADIQRDFGNVRISEDLAKAIDDIEDQTGLGRLQASLTQLDKIIQEAGGLSASNLALFTGKLRDTFSMIEMRSMTVAQVTQVLDKNFAQFAAEATDENGRLSASLKEIIDLDERFGTESEAIQQYLQGQAATAIGGFNAVVAGMLDVEGNLKVWDEAYAKLQMNKEELEKNKISTEDLANAHKILADGAKSASGGLADLGVQAVAAFGAAIQSGVSVKDAFAGIHPALVTIQQAYTDLGLSIDDPVMKTLMLRDQIVSAAPAQISAIEGLSAGMIALDNIGSMNAETFSAMQRTGFSLFERLKDGVRGVLGETATMDEVNKAALLEMQQYLHDAAKEAELLGVPLDANTQSLIDQSKKYKIWGEEGASATDVMMMGFAAIIEALGGTLPEAFKKFSAASMAAAAEERHAAEATGDGFTHAEEAASNAAKAYENTGTAAEAATAKIAPSVEETRLAYDDLKKALEDQKLQTEIAAQAEIDAVAKTLPKMGDVEEIVQRIRLAYQDAGDEAEEFGDKAADAGRTAVEGHSPGGLTDIEAHLRQVINLYRTTGQVGTDVMKLITEEQKKATTALDAYKQRWEVIQGIAGIANNVGTALSNAIEKLAPENAADQLKTLAEQQAEIEQTRADRLQNDILQGLQERRTALDATNAAALKALDDQIRAQQSLTASRARDTMIRNLQEQRTATEQTGNAAMRALDDQIKAQQTLIENARLKRDLDAESARLADIQAQRTRIQAGLAGGGATQSTFNTALHLAVASFAQQVKMTGDITSAMESVSPAFDAVEKAQKQFGFTTSASMQKIIDLHKIIKDNEGVVSAISATNQAMLALQAAGMLDNETLHMFAADATANFQTLTRDGTVPAVTALALMAPTMQVLGQHTSELGDITDQTTLAMWDMAKQYGLVGTDMIATNQRILDSILELTRAINNIPGPGGTPRPGPGTGTAPSWRLAESLTGSVSEALAAITRITGVTLTTAQQAQAASLIGYTGGPITGAQVNRIIQEMINQGLWRGYAEGGTVSPRDTVPIMAQPGERITSVPNVDAQTRAMAIMAAQQEKTARELADIKRLLGDQARAFGIAVADAMVLAPRR